MSNQTTSDTNIRQLLSEQELAQVTCKNNWLALRIVLFDWLVIILAFVLMANYPNPFTLLLGVLLIGARQLGLGVIVHEAGHRSLFSSTSANHFVGNWLAGYWVFSNTQSYMQSHIKHHQHAGTKADPDLANFKAYPISRSSLKRKFVRDATGQVGWRRIKSIARSITKLPQLDLREKKNAHHKQSLYRSIGVNLCMLAILTLFSVPWLYLVWVGAFMTSHMLVVRIRQIAEHAGVTDHFSTDVRLNTRTLYINWLERLLIAPHHVNYHLEHHLLPSAPIYQLKKLHHLLLQKGYYTGMTFDQGYYNLLMQVTYRNR
ncbi:MAG: fatty acid desaturase family protein [Pseudomonadales bacterium]|nr:fatty acid desaturase family protein [Pseudomonadales bacterium]